MKIPRRLRRTSLAGPTPFTYRMESARVLSERSLHPGALSGLILVPLEKGGVPGEHGPKLRLELLPHLSEPLSLAFFPISDGAGLERVSCSALTLASAR